MSNFGRRQGPDSGAVDLATADASKSVHLFDDVDGGVRAHHHTLGRNPRQAYPGNLGVQLEQNIEDIKADIIEIRSDADSLVDFVNTLSDEIDANTAEIADHDATISAYLSDTGWLNNTNTPGLFSGFAAGLQNNGCELRRIGKMVYVNLNFSSTTFSAGSTTQVNIVDIVLCSLAAAYRPSRDAYTMLYTTRSQGGFVFRGVASPSTPGDCTLRTITPDGSNIGWTAGNNAFVSMSYLID